MIENKDEIGTGGNSLAGLSGETTARVGWITRFLAKFKSKKYQYAGYLWLLPALVLLAAFSFYPPLSALVHAFTDWDLVSSKFIGFDNFARLFQDAIFWKSCVNLLVLLITGLIFGNIAAIFLAEMLYNLKSTKASSVYRFLFILPALVPGMVNMLLWQKIIFSPGDSGFMNAILVAFGGNPSSWYWNEKTALLSMVLTGFPWVAGTSFLIYLAGLQSIPDSVLEASTLDGITLWKRIIYIDMPLLKSQLKYFAVLGIIGGMQSFNMQLMFTKGGPNYSTTVPGYYMYERAFMYGEFGYAAAIGFLLFIVTLLITIVNNKFLKSTEEGAQ